VVALLLAAVCIVGFFAVIYGLTSDGSRLSLSSASASSNSAPLKLVQVHPALTAGLACKLVGTGEEVEQILFVRKQKTYARVELTATAPALDLPDLTYVLYDANGAEVSRGSLGLTGSLKQGDSRRVEVVDPAIQKATTMQIRR
jgi:hypothetical protein